MFFKSKNHNKEKLMVIGIDGLAHELAHHFSEAGITPNLKRWIRKCGLKKTQAPMPEVSSVSWTSFMTGLNPGGHGIYGFMELNPANYSYIFPSFRQLPVPAVWETIAQKGKRSVIMNLPGTYPVRPINGVLVSGFVAVDLENAVFPPKMLRTLEKMNYKVDVDAETAATDKTLFLEKLNQMLDMRFQLYKKLEKNQDWDLFFFIMTGTDRLHHFFYNAVDDTLDPYYRSFRDYYRRVDEIVGEVTASAERKGIPFIILSDHGFVQIKKEVYLSQYLKEWGYLDLSHPKPADLTTITEKTRAFVLDPSRIYLHKEGKYRRGTVKKEDAGVLLEELKARLLGLEIDGEKVLKNVFVKEEIYEGQFLENAPDLVLLSNYGFDLKSGITKTGFHDKTHFEGMHSQDNAFLIDACGLELPEHPFIYEIGKRAIDFSID